MRGGRNRDGAATTFLSTFKQQRQNRCPGVECTVAYAPADAGEEIRAWLGGREVRCRFFLGGWLNDCDDFGRFLFLLHLSLPPPCLISFFFPLPFFDNDIDIKNQGNPPLRFAPQIDAPDLGARMRAALNEGLGASSSPVARGAAAASLVVGSDIPDLQPCDVRAAVDALAAEAGALTATTSVKADDPGGESPDCVLGPAADGGFWVVGVRRRRSGGGGGGGESDGSHSSLLLPDTLFEVSYFFFLSLFYF